MTKSVMFVGVGGQGTLLASRIIGNAVIAEGFDAKVSEVHGMSQRGGSVSTYVKFGEEVHSPIIDKGEADIIVAFELMEAARWVSYVKAASPTQKGGLMIINTQKLDPMPVITGAVQYNEDIINKIKGLGIDVIELNALTLAEQAGSAKTVNVVMMGALSKQLDFDVSRWETAIRECVPQKALEMNLKAFELGRN
ncbi:MAG: indolepyruvate oxidoreductase subunit beta [Oscillospiraceae bacterium]|nr:indolepyruvate oxidoreductase subunit beta [Oscillospiraceae bacterium]